MIICTFCNEEIFFGVGPTNMYGNLSKGDSLIKGINEKKWRHVSNNAPRCPQPNTMATPLGALICSV
jgi:hypothetical protein